MTSDWKVPKGASGMGGLKAWLHRCTRDVGRAWRGKGRVIRSERASWQTQRSSACIIYEI